jgi:hypothetical protein
VIQGKVLGTKVAHQLTQRYFQPREQAEREIPGE